jgi:hypothetical protein
LRELSSYVFSPLREGDYSLYRGSGAGLGRVLLAAAKDGSPASLKRLEHEYELSGAATCAISLQQPICVGSRGSRWRTSRPVTP